MAERPLVAIVDDDKSIRNATSDLLKAAGFTTAAFEDAESFLGWPTRASVACLVADMRMPGMSGLELYEALVACRSRHSHRHHHRPPGRADAVARARSGHLLLSQQAVRPGRTARVRGRGAGQVARRAYTKVLGGDPVRQRLHRCAHEPCTSAQWFGCGQAPTLAS